MTKYIIILRVALRNLFSKFLNVVIGGIIFLGTALFVIGSSFINSVDNAMSKSIIGSVAGNIQVYSSKSKDDLSLFGSWNRPDINEIPDFSAIKPSLLKINNVKDVIPMGVSGAQISYGNTMDVILEKLRKAVNKRLNGNRSPDLKRQIDSYKNHVRHVVHLIQKDFGNLSLVSTHLEREKENMAVLNKASSAEFWRTFDNSPYSHLEFLENKIANLLPDADNGYLSYIGTDLESFRKNFDRMEIVDGQMVPKGQRGLLISKYVYENQFKLKIANRLDKIKEAILEKKSKISKNPDLQFLIKQNKTQTSEIVLQLDSIASEKMTKRLQDFLKTNKKGLTPLLMEFFDMNDDNFLNRYQFFYKQITPFLNLYRVKPGDIMTIKAFTKTGFIQSLNIKVYGTFQFKGLEKSSLAGGLSLMDLMSFRDLYGYMTPEKQAETKQLIQSVGAKIIDRDKAEDELFGGDSTVLSNAEETHIDEKKELGSIKRFEDKTNRVYTQAEFEKGVILNAAIILKNPDKMKDTIKEINDLSKKEGLNLKAVTWQKAAGFLGQFVVVAKAILFLVVFIIFIVALVIINNAMMMATLQRVQEIGTMRAIGAQRSFILTMILVETIMLGLTFGTAGTASGSLLVLHWGNVGIPAINEFFRFFFSGPRLFPYLGGGSVLGSLLIIVLTTTISALYPAILAMRVSPLKAMQTDE